MDGDLNHGNEPGHAGFIGVGHFRAKKINHALVEEGRLAIGRQTPNVARNQIDELREFAFTLAQLAVVVVPPARHQPRGPRLELVEEAYVDPVARVDDDVGRLDRFPHLRRQVASALGHVRVRQEQESGGHQASQAHARSGLLWSGREDLNLDLSPGREVCCNYTTSAWSPRCRADACSV